MENSVSVRACKEVLRQPLNLAFTKTMEIYKIHLNYFLQVDVCYLSFQLATSN